MLPEIVIEEKSSGVNGYTRRYRPMPGIPPDPRAQAAFASVEECRLADVHVEAHRREARGAVLVQAPHLGLLLLPHGLRGLDAGAALGRPDLAALELRRTADTAIGGNTCTEVATCLDADEESMTGTRDTVIGPPRATPPVVQGGREAIVIDEWGLVHKDRKAED